MKNDEIRFRLLYGFYTDYFDIGGRGITNTKDAISGLEKEMDQEAINANLGILENRGSLMMVHRSTSGFIGAAQITSQGVDVIEEIMEKAIENSDEELVKNIKKEKACKKKIKMFWNLALETTQVFSTIMGFARQFL